MPPFHDLMNSTEFWSSLILALVGGGGLGGWITSIVGRRKTTAESESLSTQAAKEAVSILTDQVIAPLREQVDAQARQIRHLEAQQAKLYAATSYIRAQNHWLDELCRSGLLGAKWADEHPKPRLPDMLRGTIDPTQDSKEEP